LPGGGGINRQKMFALAQRHLQGMVRPMLAKCRRSR
jgi:hypothetical protein